MQPHSFVVRPHPSKNKPLVTMVYTVKKLNDLMQQKPPPTIQWPKKNISSGEDLIWRKHGLSA